MFFASYSISPLLIHLAYFSAYSIIGLRLASRDTHDSMARIGHGTWKIDRKYVSCWVPTRFGVLETIVSAYSGKCKSIISILVRHFNKARVVKQDAVKQDFITYATFYVSIYHYLRHIPSIFFSVCIGTSISVRGYSAHHGRSDTGEDSDLTGSKSASQELALFDNMRERPVTGAE